MPRETNIQIRRGSLTEWTSANPTLSNGEIAVEIDTGTEGGSLLKVGDGSTAWNNLYYVTFDAGNLDESTTTTVPPTTTTTIACPSPNMDILMADGSLRKARDLREGDFVKTKHEETMEWGEYRISHVSIVHSERIKIVVGDINFVCSLSHKFYDEGRWIEVSNLKIGDFIGESEVFAIQEYEPGEVVKIIVEDAHTYLCEGFLSHNKSELPTTTTTTTSPSGSGLNFHTFIFQKLSENSSVKGLFT
jgi:hypothetical protein